MTAPTLRERALAEMRRRRLRQADTWVRYRDDPVGFASDVLRLAVWGRMAEMLMAIQEHDLVAIRAGRKVSKSTALVAAAMWWSMVRHGRTLITSTTQAQVKGVLWKEAARIVREAKLPFDLPLDPGTGIEFPGGGTITGRTATHRENMQGYSGAEAMYVVDEASGVAREIMEAIEGNVAGGGKIIMAANPTRVLGSFYDAFHEAAALWHGIHVSARESPNVTEGRVIIPGLAVRDWVERMEEQHGPESAFVQVHVDGEFPGAGPNAVIPLALARAAEARWSERDAEGLLHIGVDVARSGDDSTVVYPRRGYKAFAPLVARDTDSYAVATLVQRAAERHGAPKERPMVKVDVIGLGAGAYDVLRKEHGRTLDVRAVNVAESPTAESDRDRTVPGYRRLRDQLWFGLREWLDEGGAYPPSEEATRADLIAITHRFDVQGRYVVTAKDDLKSAIGRSPDHGDALCLAIYTPPTRITPSRVAEDLYR
jgi:phage terminase large subunit